MSETVQVIQRKKDAILHFSDRKKGISGFTSYSYRTHHRCHQCSVWIDKLDPDIESIIKRNEQGTLFHRICGRRLRSNPHAWKRNTPRVKVYIE